MRNLFCHPTRRQLLALGLTSGLGAASAASDASNPPIQARYPRLPERPTEAYGYRLLELALQRSGRPYTLSVAAGGVSGKRADLQMETGEANVLDVGLAQDHELRFDVVPFPLDLGLSGCRRFLVRQDTLPALERVRTLAQLRAFRMGQGEGWTDVWVLREAGLKVETAQFNALFRMLEARRFDILPLGADEAHDLLARHRAEAPSVVVAESVALHYPFARMFIVNRNEPRLREALLVGLQRAFADGSVQQVLGTQTGLGPILRGERKLPATIIGIPHPWPTQTYRSMTPNALHPAIRALLEGASSAPARPSQGREPLR